LVAQPLLRKLRRDEAAAPIAGEESTVGEEAPFPLFCVRRLRPHQRAQHVVIGIGKIDGTAQIEIALAIVFECRQRRVLAC
jgi:hypothetical protein